MTSEEYKKIHPEHKNLEGNDLWDAMEYSMLRQQEGDKVLLQVKPWYKRYKLRYLWYVKKRNVTWGTPTSASKRCKHCKRGSSSMLFMMSWDEEGKPNGKTYCMCGKELIEEPNTNWSHRCYQIKKWCQQWGWKCLEWTHLFRWSIDGRYDMFGDERYYVKARQYDQNWENEKLIMIPRKWWEYIWIKRL